MTHTVSQTTHAAHGTTNDGMQALHAQVCNDQERRFRDIFERQHRKGQTVSLIGRRIDRGRSGRPEAAAQRIHADNEMLVGVDR